MYDRSWACFEASSAIFPKVLCDEEQLIFNHFEILEVKLGSPAEGEIQVGDLLLAIDNKTFKAAQNTYIGTVLDNRSLRGLEIHAGQLIDQG